MRDRFFLDTNIIVYAIKSDEVEKEEIARNLLIDNAVVSSQIIFECINVCRRKLKYDLNKCLSFASDILTVAEIADENRLVIEKTFELLDKHSFQPFDAKIVATALIAGCSILYSEDMQHGMVIDERLTIINPFL